MPIRLRKSQISCPQRQNFLAFGLEFEQRLVHQEGRRTLEESMAIGWQLLSSLPVAELTRLTKQQIERYLSVAAHA